MGTLLDQEVQITSQNVLSTVLSKPWYAAIKVVADNNDTEKEVSSCNDYFTVSKPNIRALNDMENNAFLEFKVMCEASRILSQATESVTIHRGLVDLLAG